jgi:hypothetical protein
MFSLWTFQLVTIPYTEGSTRIYSSAERVACQARLVLAGTDIQMRSSNNFCVYTPGQIFTFGSITFVANSVGRLELVEAFSACQVFFFDNLEFVINLRGEPVLRGPVLYRAHEEGVVFCNPPASHFITNVNRSTTSSRSMASLRTIDTSPTFRQVIFSGVVQLTTQFLNLINIL